MKYLTQLIGKKVITPEGATAGRIVDALATLGGRYPSINAVIVRADGREILLPYDALVFESDGPTGSGQIRGDVHLRAPLSEIPRYEPEAGELRLARALLDKQIVDVQGHRVVRVNDVRMAECGDNYCVVGVDASLRAFLRRSGSISRPIETAAKLLGRPLRSNLIAWDDVHALESGSEGGTIQLKVSHDRIARLHPADIADIVEQLSPHQQVEVIESMDSEVAADVLAEAEPEVQVSIMEHLDNETRTDIFDAMEPDEAADLLEDLPNAISDEVLESMEPEQAEDVKELMAYDEDTAGGLMTTEYVAIQANLTCEATINRLRDLAPRAETIYYVYVVDDDERLVGVLSLRDLVIAPPETHISDIMVHNVIHVYEDDHADDVAQTIGRYNLLAVPVVSADERLLGIITVDDTIERLLPPERRRRLPVPAYADAE